MATSFLNVLLNAIVYGALLSIIAIGFTLIFGVGGVLNFAHGGLITVGAVAGYLVSNPRQMAMGPWAGLVVAMVVTGLVGGVMYLGVVRFIEDQPVTLAILTFVIGFFLANLVRIFFVGATQFTIRQPVGGAQQFLGQSIQNMALVTFVISWLAIAAVFLFVDQTKTGKAVIATSMSKKGAALVGIRAEKVNLIVWVLAAAFAGMAGVLLTIRQGVWSWSSGTNPLILAFAIVILGGLGSIRGSVVGAYVIAFTNIATGAYIDPRLRELSALLLLVLFLLVKPEGLFGREAAE